MKMIKESCKIIQEKINLWYQTLNKTLQFMVMQ